MGNQISQVQSGRAPLLDLPAELIRKIGYNLDTPFELLNFACVSKDIRAAISQYDLYLKEAICQREYCSERSQGRAGIGMTKGMPLIPSLYWLLCLRKDVEQIRLCVAAYWKNFPHSLKEPRCEFCWRGSTNAPKPLVITKGRLDVIQAFFEIGVPIINVWEYGGFGDWQKRYQMKDKGLKERLGNLVEKRKGQSYFSRACIGRYDDMACYMIDKGLKVKVDHIYYAALGGCVRALDALLKHTTFTNSDEYHPIVADILDSLVGEQISPADSEAYKEIFGILLKAAEHPSFNKVLVRTPRMILAPTPFIQQFHTHKVLQH